jgi:hypothetical protein
MRNSEAVANINNYTPEMIERHNSLCDSKVHVTGLSTGISVSEAAEVMDTVAHIDGLSQAEIDTNINPSLNDSSKLSGWPC